MKITPANEQERAQVADLAREIRTGTGDKVEVAFVDHGYTGEEPAAQAAAQGMRLEVKSASSISAAEKRLLAGDGGEAARHPALRVRVVRLHDGCDPGDGRFFKEEHRVIIPLTVQEILDEEMAHKLT